MRNLWIAAAAGALLAGPAAAQSLNDAGQLLQRILPGQQQPSQSQADRDRAIYEQGRRDAAEDARRRRDEEDRYGQRRGDDRRRAAEDRSRYDPRDDPRDGRDRRRGGSDRPYDDADRPPPGRYQPDNR